MISPPPALSAALDAAAATVPARRLAGEVDALRDGYRTTGSARDLSREAAVAYAVYRLPATYAAVRSALDAVVAGVPGLAPRSVLDLGGGSGAGAWAAKDVWPDAEVRVVDRDRSMLAVGRELGYSLDGVRWDTGDIRSTDATAELALVSYSLGELPPEDRTSLGLRLPALAATVLVVEPGTPRGFEVIRSVRSSWTGAGRSIAAPCPHDGPCPMTDHDWCHFAVRLPRSRAHRLAKGGSLGYEDEKFSYVCTSVLPRHPATARILRHPQFRSGRVELTLCTPDGVARRTVTRSDRVHYRPARDAEWGDRWPPEAQASASS